MTSTPLGIVIPAYDAGGKGKELLRNCLDSIARQSLLPSQVIVSAERDFFSAAGDVVSEVSSALRVVLTENRRLLGIGGNSNSGLDLLESEYAWVLHQDDRLIGPETVNRVTKAIEATGAPWLVLRPVEVNPMESACLDTNVGTPVWRGRGYLLTGRNPLGPPSTSVWRLSQSLRFDEKLSLLVDLDLYLSLNSHWNVVPHLIDEAVGVGVWSGQTQRTKNRKDLATELPELWWRTLRQRRVKPQGFA